MKEMKLREKIGQMIMTGFPAAQITPDLMHLIEDYKVANIILFSYNVCTNEQISGNCRFLHRKIEEATGFPAFIAIDQEGGVVTRLPKNSCNVPGAMLIGATGDEKNAYRAGVITGAELRAIGINMDLAPVLDVNSNPDNPVIGTRSYSSEVSVVERFGRNMIKGLQHEKVLPTAKHFPGHGDTAVDSHLGLPVVEKDLSQLRELELIPFQSAVDQGIPCVMTSHILFPKLEKEHVPATMSKSILTGLLREEMGFQGIIITDCLEMGAIVNNYGTAKAAVEAIKAGAQLLCISHTPALVIEAIQRIEEAVQTGEIPISMIDDAVTNILKYKEQYKPSLEEEQEKQPGSGMHNSSGASLPLEEEQEEPFDRGAFRKEIENMALSGITKVSEGQLPEISKQTVFLGCYAYRSTLVTSAVNKELHFAKYMAEKLGCRWIDVPLNPTQEEIDAIVRQLADVGSVVYGLYNGHLNHGQIRLARKLDDSGKAVTAVALRNPYDLAFLGGKIHKIAAYEYNETVFDALLGILTKDAAAVGKLPVELVEGRNIE